MVRVVRPELNTWVTVAAEQSARSKHQAATPALVSAIDDEARQATLIYGNELVLVHKFSGPPLKRIVVPFRRLRPGQGTERLRQLLLAAVRAAAAEKRAELARDADAGEEGEAAEALVDEAPKTASMECHSSTTQVNVGSNVDVVDESSLEPVGSLKPMPAPTLQCIRQSAIEDAPDAGALSVPDTPRLAKAPRARSRSRSKPRSKPPKTRSGLPGAVLKATAKLLGSKDQVPLSELLSALEASGGLEGWTARDAVAEMDTKNKIFVADELVFRL